MKFSGRVTKTSFSEMSLNSTPAHVVLAPLSPFEIETFMPMADRVCRMKPTPSFCGGGFLASTMRCHLSTSGADPLEEVRTIAASWRPMPRISTTAVGQCETQTAVLNPNSNALNSKKPEPSTSGARQCSNSLACSS